jgi:hypothetical protein
VAGDAIDTYARADWRATGIDPEVFWRDLLEWSIHAEDYGLLNRIEVEPVTDPDDACRRCGGEAGEQVGQRNVSQSWGGW